MDNPPAGGRDRDALITENSYGFPVSRVPTGFGRSDSGPSEPEVALKPVLAATQLTWLFRRAAHAFHQPVSVVEGTEGGGVMREDAQDPTPALDWVRVAHAASDLSSPMVASPGPWCKGDSKSDNRF